MFRCGGAKCLKSVMDSRVKKLKPAWAIVGWREQKVIGVCIKTKKKAFVPGHAKMKARCKMKAIKTCGACPGKMEYENSGVFMCPEMILKKGKVEEMRLDLSTIHPDCPLSDAPDDAGLAGKLREKIKRASLIFDALEGNHPLTTMGRKYSFDKVLKWIDDFASSPAVPAPVNVKKIEWREIDAENLWWGGPVSEEFVSIMRTMGTNMFTVVFHGDFYFLNHDRSVRKREFDTLELAQQAAQAAFEAFAKGLME